MVASPEKALFDKIIFTSGLRIRSRLQAEQVLLEDFRVEQEGLKRLKVKDSLSWLSDAPKAESIRHIIEFIQHM